MSTNGKQIKLGALLSYFGVFLGIISGLIYNPWMIQKIGDADYGLYTLSMSLINIFLVDFGLSMAVQRYVAKYRAEQDQQAVNDTVGLIYRLYGVLTAILVILFVCLYFFLDMIYVKLTPEELVTFKILYIMVALYSITAFPFIPLNGILSSYEKFIPLKISDLLYKILTVGLTALALFAGYGVYVLVVINLFACVIVTAVRIFFVRKYVPLRPNWSDWDLGKVKDLFGFSIWAAISGIVLRLLTALGPSILGIVSGSFEIAVLGYALSMESYVYAFVNAINGFFMPRLSEISLDGEGKEPKVLSLMVSVGRFILLMFSLIYVGFAAVGREFISLLVGADYQNAYFCVLFICAYGVVAYPQQIANTYTMVQNEVKKRAYISLLAFAVYLLCVFAFGYWWGAVGISFAICLSLIVQTLGMNLLYQRVLHLDMRIFFRECHGRMLPGLLLFLLASFALAQIPFGGWIGFAVKVVCIVAVYLAVVWCLILQRQEKNGIKNMLRRKKKGGNGNADLA